MSHSNSSLNTFANCMAKYKHNYILKTPPCKPISPHLTFGIMAHEVLNKAGILRDAAETKIISSGDYMSVIPSEILNNDLKLEFGIGNWERYFQPVIKQTAIYEKMLIDEMHDLSISPCTIEREVKLSVTVEQLQNIFDKDIRQPFVGVIDLLLTTQDYAIIIDYKFSSNKKTQDDFDMGSQLQLYALFVHLRYDIPIENIKIGFIDIPKTCFGEPKVLTNGTLSRAKDQNVSQDIYEKAVKAIHGDDPVYNCEPGGHYYDIYRELALNKAAYLQTQWLDISAYKGILTDVLDAAMMIDMFIAKGLPFLRKYDSYSCCSCEYVSACKPWLTVNGG